MLRHSRIVLHVLSLPFEQQTITPCCTFYRCHFEQQQTIRPPQVSLFRTVYRFHFETTNNESTCYAILELFCTLIAAILNNNKQYALLTVSLFCTVYRFHLTRESTFYAILDLFCTFCRFHFEATNTRALRCRHRQTGTTPRRTPVRPSAPLTLGVAPSPKKTLQVP
jgi:hypothetical protein